MALEDLCGSTVALGQLCRCALDLEDLSGSTVALGLEHFTCFGLAGTLWHWSIAFLQLACGTGALHFASAPAAKASGRCTAPTG